MNLKKCRELLKYGYDKCPPLEHGYPEDDCIYNDRKGYCLKYGQHIKKEKEADEQERSF